jgi:hypothetical protein
MRLLTSVLFSIAIGTTSASAADPMSALHFLVGTWHCSYNSGKTHGAYTATFDYDLGGNWMRERDSWTGGGGDQGMFTYEPKRRGWTAIVIEEDRTTVVFHGAGNNANSIVYRSVYPDASMTDVFERKSATSYALHFTQSAGGKTTKSTDTCVKE